MQDALNRASTLPHLDGLYSASLALRGISDSEALRRRVGALLPADHIALVDDSVPGWIFVYSSYLEIIGPGVIRFAQEILAGEEELDDGWFATFSPPGNALILRRGNAGEGSVATGAWDMRGADHTYIELDGIPCAPWTGRGVLFEALVAEARRTCLPVTKLLTGLDALRAKDAANLDACIPGRATNVQSVVARVDAAAGVTVVDDGGVYSVPREAVERMHIVDSSLSGYGLSTSATSAERMILEWSAARYVVLSEEDSVSYSIDDVRYSSSGRESVLYLLAGAQVDPETLVLSGRPLVIAERRLPPGYHRYSPVVKSPGTAKHNISGVDRTGPWQVEYTHVNRRCPWTGSASEWNIDSMSGLEDPFPSIAVSRRSAAIPSGDAWPFQCIRPEERPHMHPTFTELYHARSGAIHLVVYPAGRRIVVKVPQGGHAIVRPGVPHVVAQAEGGDDGTYRQICVQFPSRFHYPYHETKRNYDPENP